MLMSHRRNISPMFLTSRKLKIFKELILYFIERGSEGLGAVPGHFRIGKPVEVFLTLPSIWGVIFETERSRFAYFCGSLAQMRFDWKAYHRTSFLRYWPPYSTSNFTKAKTAKKCYNIKPDILRLAHYCCTKKYPPFLQGSSFFSWPSGLCIELQSYFQGFDTQLVCLPWCMYASDVKT